MVAQGEFDFEKLAREIVSSRLSRVENAPGTAAEIAKKIIVAAVKSTKVRQDPKTTVIQVCRGVLSGIMFIGQDIPETAIQILKMMSPIALELHLDPGDLMTWAMEGIADVTPMTGMDVRGAIRGRIEELFMGTGTIFSELCDKAAKAK